MTLSRFGRLVLVVVLPLAVLCGSAASATEGYRLLRLDGVGVKWDAPVPGAPASVTYGFASRAEVFPDAINCGELAPVDEAKAAWGGDRGRLERLVAQAFGMWSHAAAILFRPAVAGETPEILIGAEGRPRKVAFTNVWHADPAPGGAMASLTRATICLNPGAAWGAPAPDGLDVRTVLAHEIGHAIGLDHPGARGALMGYSNQGGLSGLMAGDRAGAVALYGPAMRDRRQ